MKRQIIICLIGGLSGIGATPLILTADNATVRYVGQEDEQLGVDVSWSGQTTQGQQVIVKSQEITASGSMYLIRIPNTVSGTNNIQNETKFIKQDTADQVGAMSNVQEYAVGGGDMNGDGFPETVLMDPVNNMLRIILGVSTNMIAPVANISEANVNLLFEGQVLPVPAGNSLRNVSIKGDLNGDGYSDLVVGASSYDVESNNDSRGRVYILFGKDRLGVNQSGMINAQASVLLNGALFQGHLGHAVDIVPDVNGDGIDDLLIGSFNEGSSMGGAAYLLYGRSDWSSLTDTNIENQSDAIFASKENGSDGFGERVHGMGDINGDGFGDFAISAPYANNRSGWVYLYLGGEDKPFTNKDSQVNTYSKIIKSQTSLSQTGLYAIGSVGDVDGDQLADIVIGDRGRANNNGAVFVVSGASLVGAGDLVLETDAAIIIEGRNRAYLGYSVEGIGDINHDGINDIAIGEVGYDARSSGDVGAISIYQLRTNRTPNITNARIEAYVDSSYTQSITDIESYAPLYVEVIVQVDIEVGTQNILEIDMADNYTLSLRETGLNTNKYRGVFKTVETRNEKRINQVVATKNNNLIIALKDDNSIQKVINVINAKPEITTLITQQVSLGSEAKVRLDYTATDKNNESIQLTAQYSTNNIQWLSATLSGTSQNAKTYLFGQEHTAQFEPLYWEVGSDESSQTATYTIRMRAHDGEDSSEEYAVSAEFLVDNTPPHAPVLSHVATRNALQITIAGSAENNAQIEVYVDGVLSITGNASSTGAFSLFPVNVTLLSAGITAVAIDSVGNRSVETSPVGIVFGSVNYILEDTESDVTASVLIPFGSRDDDQELKLDIIDVAVLQAQNGSPPSFNQYVYGFDLKKKEGADVNLRMTVNAVININESIDVTENIQLKRWTQQGWVSDQLVINKLTPTQLHFQTTYLTRFALIDIIDTRIPAIESIEINGKEAVNGDFYTKTPIISVQLTDMDTGISSWVIQIKKEETIITQNNQSDITEGSYRLNPILQITTPLEPGEYTLRVIASDHSESLAVTKTITFKVSDILDMDMLAAPNPFHPQSGLLTIGYTLTVDIDSLDMYILNARRDIVWYRSASGADTTTGYHYLEWDGRRKGRKIPNGLYYIYGVAKKGTDSIKKKLRIVVLK